MLPGEHKLNALRLLAAEVIGGAGQLAAHGMPRLRTLLREALRPMNSYYTNKIEGQQTEPLLIERAMRQDFSRSPDEARRQRIAIAHIDTERWSETAWKTYDSATFFSPETVCEIHRHLQLTGWAFTMHAGYTRLRQPHDVREKLFAAQQGEAA